MNALLARLIPLVINVISPELRAMLVKFVEQLDKQAKATVDNPWDDFLVAILKAALNMK